MTQNHIIIKAPIEEEGEWKSLRNKPFFDRFKTPLKLQFYDNVRISIPL